MGRRERLPPSSYKNAPSRHSSHLVVQGYHLLQPQAVHAEHGKRHVTGHVSHVVKQFTSRSWQLSCQSSDSIPSCLTSFSFSLSVSSPSQCWVQLQLCLSNVRCGVLLRCQLLRTHGLTFFGFGFFCFCFLLTGPLEQRSAIAHLRRPILARPIRPPTLIDAGGGGGGGDDDNVA